MMLPVDASRGMFAKRNGATNMELTLDNVAERERTMQLPMHTKAASIASDNFEDVRRCALTMSDARGEL